jgi:hypothetical protein
MTNTVLTGAADDTDGGQRFVCEHTARALSRSCVEAGCAA